LQSVSDVSQAVRGGAAVDDLDLSSLDRVLEHEAGDLTCTVEAGLRLSALQALLAEHGQMLALDPPGDPTIGACIADDLHGPRSHRYGRMRDLLLGVTVVLGDGLVASSGGKVVKNVAGYDLGKLLCGSRGTLGVICRASLRLHPLPDATATLIAPVSGDGEAKRQAILRSTLVPSAIDVTGERLAVMFEGSVAAVAFQLEAARALVGGEPAGDEVWDEVRARPRTRVDADDLILQGLHERIRVALAQA
jgi:glycolate dehydrogenase FAD-binding subunit